MTMESPLSGDAKLDLDALRAVLKAEGRDTTAVQSCYDGKLPPQRLSGLQRRGLLRFDWGCWYLTPRGRDKLEAARR